MPAAIDQRLSDLQEGHQRATSEVKATVFAHIADLAKSQAVPLPPDTSGSMTGSSILAAGVLNTMPFAGALNARPSVSGADGHSRAAACDFRLLVEDQHWAIIQLLRALSMQLGDVVKRSAGDSYCGPYV